MVSSVVMLCVAQSCPGVLTKGCTGQAELVPLTDEETGLPLTGDEVTELVVGRIAARTSGF